MCAFRIEYGGVPKRYKRNYHSRVKICKICNRTWQFAYTDNFKKVPSFIQDYPRYGLDFKTCPICKSNFKLKKKLKIERNEDEIC